MKMCGRAVRSGLPIPEHLVNVEAAFQCQVGPLQSFLLAPLNSCNLMKEKPALSLPVLLEPR